jgi:hypothetical protein
MYHRQESFYLTLPSNSRKSQSLFPNNTVAHYTSMLHHPISLEGRWEVALVECVFPISFFNVGEDECILSYNITRRDTDQIADGRIIIPAGYYANIERILSYINRESALSSSFVLEYDEITCRVNFRKLIHDHDLMIFMSSPLQRILGFRDIPLHPPFDGRAKDPVDLHHNIPHQAFIYTDIVEPQLVGDSAAPLLRIVGIQEGASGGGGGGSTMIALFDTPHYIPVLKRHFDRLDIDMRTSTNRPLPFQSGPSTCKLHFRRQ